MESITAYFVVGLILVPIAAVVIYELMRVGDDHPQWMRTSRIVVVLMILAVATAVFLYRTLQSNGHDQTAALFVGIPAVLAIFTIFLNSSTAIGVAIKTVTVGLLFSLLFLDEGVVCVLMSAPLFYAIAFAVGTAIQNTHEPEQPKRYFSSWITLMAMVPMSLEGTMPSMTVARDATVTETRIVPASAAAVEAAIASTPRFDRPLPFFLSIGFPRPTQVRIADNTWTVRMRGGELRINGMEPRAGNLVLVRDGLGDNFISWKAVADDSHMTHYLNWTGSRMEWQAIDATTTRVTWTIHYRRGLDPAWYFGPMQRYAMHLAAGYLIDAVATP